MSAYPDYDYPVDQAFGLRFVKAHPLFIMGLLEKKAISREQLEEKVKELLFADIPL